MAKINGKNIGDLPGTIKTWGNGTAPSGYFVCDGRSLSQTQYAGLFAKIGTSFGDGSTGTVYGTPGGLRFNLPDLRGRFLRGVDGTSGNDPDKASRTAMATGGATGNAVGSVQGDVIRNINGTFFSNLNNVDSGNNSGAFYRAGNNTGTSTHIGPGAETADQIGFDASLVVPTSTENRPKNAYVNYIIKY